MEWGGGRREEIERERSSRLLRSAFLLSRPDTGSPALALSQPHVNIQCNRNPKGLKLPSVWEVSGICIRTIERFNLNKQWENLAEGSRDNWHQFGAWISLRFALNLITSNHPSVVSRNCEPQLTLQSQGKTSTLGKYGESLNVKVLIYHQWLSLKPTTLENKILKWSRNTLFVSN